MITKATPKDMLKLCKLALNFAEHSPYPELIDLGKIVTILGVFLEDPDKVILWEVDKGMLLAMKTEFLFGGDPQAAEIAWWVEPEYRATGIGKELMDAFEDWATRQGCKLLTMVSIDSTLGTYYEKRGYTLHERAYMKTVNQEVNTI